MTKLQYFPQRRATTEPLWKVMAYTTSGANFPVESNESWTSLEEAQAAADRMNVGNKAGMTFASYSDD